MKPSAALRDHFDPVFPDFNTEYPTSRADEFLNEFDEFVRAREGKGTELPAYVLLTCPTTTTAPHRANLDRLLPLQTTTWLSAELWKWSRTVPIGTTPQFSSSKTTLRTAPTTWMPIVDRLRDQQILTRIARTSLCGQPFYTTVNMVHTIEAL
jgi:hypothetical protein